MSKLLPPSVKLAVITYTNVTRNTFHIHTLKYVSPTAHGEALHVWSLEGNVNGLLLDISGAIEQQVHEDIRKMHKLT